MVKTEPVDVCLITEYYHPTLSGATERFRRYTPGFKQRGINMRVMTVLRSDVPLRESIDGVPVQRFPIDKIHIAPSAILLRKTFDYFRATGDWPQLVQIISHTLQGVPDICRFRLKGIPCINTITLMPPLVSGSIQRTKSSIHQWLRYSSFNLLITSGQTVSERLAKFGISPKRLLAIPNGVDVRRFHPVGSQQEKLEIRLRLNMAPKDEIILFVGFISYRKGVDLLLGAWSRIVQNRPRAHLFLVGPVDSPSTVSSSLEKTFYEEIKKTTSMLPFPEKIHFIGEVNNVDEFMRAADVFVLPSRLEGWGNVAAEAMASGLPCVLTPYEGLPDEFGKPSREFLLATFDQKSIADSVINLLEDTSERNEIGLNARSQITAFLNVENSLDKFANMYRGLRDGRF